MNARNELRDCFLSDSRDRFEAAADAYRAEVLREAQREVVAWLSKKAREDKMWDAGVLASKVDRGAIRLFLNAAEQGGGATQPAPHEDESLPPQLRDALRRMAKRGPVIELTRAGGKSAQPADPTACTCMPHRKFACGHCDMDICQDCGHCPCGCDCNEGGE